MSEVVQFPGGEPKPEAPHAPSEVAMPPHFFVLGWDWKGARIPPHGAAQVFISSSPPSLEKHPEAFRAISFGEHEIYLRMNRAEVWKRAIELIREVKMDPNTFILEAHKLGQMEISLL